MKVLGTHGIYIYIPGSSRYVKCMPLVVFLGEKAQILHTWKIQVYILCFFRLGWNHQQYQVMKKQQGDPKKPDRCIVREVTFATRETSPQLFGRGSPRGATRGTCHRGVRKTQLRGRRGVGVERSTRRWAHFWLWKKAISKENPRRKHIWNNT